MKKLVNLVDSWIEKIPLHIRDIIQKAAFALFALLAIVSITIGIMKGINDAHPKGMQLAEDSDALFYMELLREQNKEKAKLLEDIPIDANLFPSRSRLLKEEAEFVNLGADRSERLMGEPEAFINDSETLRRKNKEPSFLAERETLFDENIEQEFQAVPEIPLGKNLEKEKTLLKNNNEEIVENSFDKNLQTKEKNETETLPFWE